MYTAKWFRASVKTPKAGDQVIILLNPPSLHHNTTIRRYLVIENQFSRTLKIACITLDSNWTLIWHCLCLLMALETPPPLNLIEKMTGVAHLIGWHKWQGWQGCPTWWYWRRLAFLSPSGDLGIGLVWDNHPPILSNILVWVLKFSVCGQNAKRTKCQPDIMPTKGWHFVRTYFCGWHFVRPNFLVGILSGPSQHVLVFCPNHENPP